MFFFLMEKHTWRNLHFFLPNKQLILYFFLPDTQRKQNEGTKNSGSVAVESGARKIASIAIR